jgi:hypothetical protein
VSPISLLPAEEPVLKTVRSVRPVKAAAAKQLVQPTCARPTARVPLSLHCRQVRAVAVLRIAFRYASRPEVRQAYARTVARITVRRVDGRAPPDSKAAKKRPVAEVRPMIPFGSSGQGVESNGFNGSPGSTSSSRLFALAAAPLKVPLPFRSARLNLPSTLPQGVIAAPPTARPG